MTLQTQDKSKHRQAFFIALAIGIVVFLPFVIQDGGYFTYYGDFNVQQIPFYQLAHRAVRSGDVWWNWYTDLGANFLGSYSFYLLFSPFFWITLIFPNSWLPFLMAPLLVLKTATASFTAYFYLERFVRDKNYAVIGALLYAFSGWMDYNIFFNHFHEVAVFFPLLLLGVEKLVTENKRGFFAVTVLVNAVVNYWFFVGETVFVVIYVLVRMSDAAFGMNGRKFARLAWEAVLGAGCAAVVLLPSAMAIMGNPRTASSELLTGWNFWVYWHEQRQPAIVQSLFFPPDLPARTNFFPDHGAQWASLSGWLPLFGMTGVLAYFFANKGAWLKRMLAVCLLCALIPGLNSLFILLNHSYYARWFYMPILLMSLATIRALEQSALTTRYFRRALRWSAVAVGFYAVMCGLTPNFQEDKMRFGMEAYPLMFWATVGIAVACLLLTAFLILWLRPKPHFRLCTTVGISLVSALFLLFYLGNGRYVSDSRELVLDTAIPGAQYITLPREPFARTDVYDESDNLAMFWGLPNIQAFHSIVPPSIMEFYPAVGVTRDVGSRPQREYYALRPLLSVRWLFIRADKEEQSPMPGYRKYSEMAGFYVYENENYIPMGFGYTRYVTRTQLEELPVEQRSHVMLRAVVLEDDAVERHQDLLRHLVTPEGMEFDENTVGRDSANRRVQAADSFQKNNDGFISHTSFAEETLLFFSVPIDEGWTATLDGAAVDIERANIGFMAVRVPAGEHELRFVYRTPGLKKGGVISLVSLGLLLLYLLVSLRAQKRDNEKLRQRRAQFQGAATHLSWSEYLELLQDRQRRRANLQRTLNQASSVRSRGALSPEEHTLLLDAVDEEDGGEPLENG